MMRSVSLSPRLALGVLIHSVLFLFPVEPKGANGKDSGVPSLEGTIAMTALQRTMCFFLKEMGRNKKGTEMNVGSLLGW
jgi:hypothetical protein